ncbi:MAG: hypothetical protein ACKO0U_12620, partial [Gammaproteobacteria bacterium]
MIMYQRQPLPSSLRRPASRWALRGLPVRICGAVAALILGCALATAPAPALAESTQLQTLREQLRQLEQLGTPELAPMADSLRELIRVMEEEERSAAGNGGYDDDTAGDDGDESTIGSGEETPPQRGQAPAQPKPKSTVVRKSYFVESGQPQLERCPRTGEVQIDTLCAGAMIRYQNYLGAGGGDGAEELWIQHAQTAKVY